MIDFLLENPLLLIFLIGIITSLFGKKVNDQQPDKQKQPRGMSVEEQEEARRQMMQDAEKQEEVPPVYDRNEEKLKRYAKDIVQEASVEVSDRKKEAEERLADLRKQKAEAQKRASAFLSATKNKDVANNKVDQPSMRVSNKQLVDAVVWSEILGQPRSRNPHRTMKRK
ncbi:MULTISPECIES: hypothetical protein [Cytobacillus]|uniref:Uncharacterized protein n=1 Tax=Cytobacillus stercorigallinarum TaxID=2762240 RepID=A0ABR8QJV7_9BACI|nr:hypothetical protein [Cytobacillus stercorigallinarum]MBD7935807.1 hypothetical protein [Cytobacillus stercorigallinarum]